MALIGEKAIRGDRDIANPFQWEVVRLNLPGSEGYTPSLAWISKRRMDGLLASDFVCFVNDQRLARANSDQINEAGHALSLRESYLGIQDALRKLRAAGGLRRPGAWTGTVVFINEETGLVVLTSQDKWDRMKLICNKWFD